VINVFEILRGLRSKGMKNTEIQFNELLEDMVVLSIDKEVISIAADIYSYRKNKGLNLEDADILIAAITIRNNGILVTNNIKHFENIDNLVMENWI
jgi:tRNA(fMet)-specific endonuclease VapC